MSAPQKRLDNVIGMQVQKTLVIIISHWCNPQRMREGIVCSLPLLSKERSHWSRIASLPAFFTAFCFFPFEVAHLPMFP